jgi:hypothetical protein
MGRPTPAEPMPVHRARASLGASLRASPTPRPPADQRTALAGVLEQFGLSSVLVLLDLERKSGVTLVAGKSGRGRIYVREGRVVRAAIEGDTGRGGARAVYEILTWSDGRFEFHPGEVEGADEIGSSTSFLLMEGARLQDERREAAKKSQN